MLDESAGGLRASLNSYTLSPARAGIARQRRSSNVVDDSSERLRRSTRGVAGGRTVTTSRVRPPAQCQRTRRPQRLG